MKTSPVSWRRIRGKRRRFGKATLPGYVSPMALGDEELKQRIIPPFRENFERFGELGAAVSIWQNGKPIVDFYGGFCDARHEKPWDADTLVLIWSATKGIGNACVLHVLQEHRIGSDRYVAEFWA